MISLMSQSCSPQLAAPWHICTATVPFVATIFGTQNEGWVLADISTALCTPHKRRDIMTVNIDLGKLWKKVDMTKFKVLFQHLTGRTEENQT